jgi:hypothetical protein
MQLSVLKKDFNNKCIMKIKEVPNPRLIEKQVEP